MPAKQTAKTTEKVRELESALTQPLHSQVIYDIEIDDNFYYMHFRLNLRNKIVDFFPLFLSLSVSIFFYIFLFCSV